MYLHDKKTDATFKRYLPRNEAFYVKNILGKIEKVVTLIFNRFYRNDI